ncbi:MAG: N-acetylmuramoyl-L-alanine amidase family 2 [candidate division WS6 bacterium GW2011_GWC1_36_11]|uniref:N-acetylmuramoyl-L-alanine amidase family 2 n=2 Tax=Candidatus Dojkabacteria TaxID=74243 RepID=A0A0G0GNC1_9BACT|nr:MAG: N-acetylmuramoyl-L-alanine amidase family 2 [candidate division WS6 bacterium GW2011_GWC1_36_11]KKQ12033.1 MAG: N-acetylmuramoyl-L-alanine amidase family 2 [candidate division WS6 bacterium GW2011_GWC2_36_7]
MKSIAKLILAIFFLLIPVGVFASTTNTITDQKFDETISDQTQTKYVTPTTIYITQITTTSSELQKNPSLWVKALYYYSITRLHFADIPYNYLIDSNGEIYEGRSGGVGANPELRDAQGSILIGYLSNDSVITNRASTSMYTLVDSLASTWGISNLSVSKFNIVQQEGQLSKLVPVELKGEFKQSVLDTFSQWKGYKSEKLAYKTKIEEVTYDTEVVIGSKLHVTVTVKNLNDFTWLTDKNPIYISVKDGADSKFAINGVWDSFSKPTHISDSAVKAGETATFEFDLLAQVAPGKAAESFEILKFNNQPFKDSAFDVKFNIVKGNKTLVEVSSSEYGFANIRSCQWYSCKILDTVDNGVVYILLSEENGWMQIQYTEDIKGWVFSRYMKKI